MDFRAIILAELDTANAQSQLNSFISQAQGTPIQIPVNLNNMGQQGSQAGASFANSFNNAFNGGMKVGKNATVTFNNITRNIQRQQRQWTASINSAKINTFDNQITAWARNNSKAINAVMRDGSQTYGQAMSDYHRQINDLMSDINANGGVITQGHQSTFNSIRDGFRELQSEARATGNVGKTFGEQFTSAFSNIAKFAASYIGIRQVFNTIQDGIKTVNELDDALVDLQKTSTATPQQLNSFYKEANDIAKQYGTSTRQVIQGAADWSRLGYNLEDSKTMSKLSSQFAAISPGMDVEQSTSSLVSTMKAFGIETNDVLDGIMSKVNIVGKFVA